MTGDSHAPAAPPSSGSRRSISVLVVDDDEVDRELVRRCMLRTGIAADVVEESDPLVALATIRRTAPDIVVLDYSFPKHDGLVILQELRDKDAMLPVIVLTGHEDAELAVTLMKAGAIDYIPKAGLTPERLAQSVRHALRLRASEVAARAAQEALRASEEFNRSVLEASHDCIKVLDLEGKLLSMSARGQAMFAISDFSKLRGQSWLSFWKGEYLEAAERAVQEAREGRAGRFVGCCTTPQGQQFWFDVLVTPIAQGKAPPQRLLAVSRDVTQQHMQAEFEQQLLGIVSHDLRNPIAAMVMGGTLLAQLLPGDTKAGAIAARLARSGDRASRLVDDLLDFTQVRLAGGLPVHASENDLHAVCRQAVEELAIAHPDRTLEHVAEGDGQGTWDPDRLAQVISNLALNAVTYSPEDTPVTVRTVGHPSSVRLEVHNHGDPIAPEVLSTLFQPFQRGERKHGAERRIGLGLFIVHHIVVAHGGTVEVRSSKAEGTTFLVELPRAR